MKYFPKAILLFAGTALSVQVSLSALETVGGGNTPPIVCSQDTQGYPGEGKCSNESRRCQAVTNVNLKLNCTACSPLTAGITWQFNSTNKTFNTAAIDKYLKSQVGTVAFILASYINFSQGCISCKCKQQSKAATVYGVFSVEVREGQPPHLAVGNMNDSQNYYVLDPPHVNVPFSPSDNGSYCMYFESTGYPSVNYYATYTISSETESHVYNASDDVCLSYNSTADRSVLCLIPTLENVNQTRMYTINISNHAGSIYASQKFSYSGAETQTLYDWFLDVHPEQSSGALNTGEAFCAAYDQADASIEYIVCSLPSVDHLPYSRAQLPCQYARGDLNCCACGDANCSLNITTQPSSAHSKVPTSTCRINTTVLEGSYACLAIKQYYGSNILSSAPQLLDTFSFKALHPTASSQSDLSVPIWSAAIVLSVLGLLLVLLTLSVVGVGGMRVARWYRRRQGGNGGGQVPIDSEHRDGERQPLLQGVPENNPRYGEPPRTPSSTFSTAYQQPIEEEGGRPRGESCIEPPRKGSRLVVMESHTHKEVTESLVSTESLPEDTTYILKPGSSYIVQLGSKSVKIIAPDPSSLNDVVDLMPMSCDSDTPSTDQPRPQLYVDCFKSIPPNIDQLVELSMIELLPYIEKLAPKWDEIGNSLGLEDKVRILRMEPSAPTLTGKMSMLFESWLDSGNDVSWHTLVTVLRSVGCQRAAIAMSSYLHDQVHDLPPDIDDQVPVEMRVLIKIVSKVAPYWEKIGHLLKLYDTLKELKGSKSSNLVKMTILLETWAERRDNGTTWAVLLSVLEKDVELLGEGAKLRHYILEELKRRQDKRPSVSHLT